MAGPGPEVESGEDRLIGRFLRPLAKDPRALSLIDDVAVMIPPAGFDLILKTDAIVGTVHFLPDDPADAIARKALRVNLSDLAAKGAAPSGYLLTLALPDGISDEWLSEFARGLGEDAEMFGCPLLGGDTVKTPGPMMISITVLGLVPTGAVVPRTGAKPGDRVLVTGTIGDAVLGLRLRRDPSLASAWRLDVAQREALIQRYRVPRPRNALAEALRSAASGAMDVSDGLVGDLAKLCRASGVDAEVNVARVPFSPGAQAALWADPALTAAVLTGGDDYEIVCAVPPEQVVALMAAASRANVPLTEIGTIVSGTGIPRFLGEGGQPMTFERPSFSHF